ncbi:uncharacterized protein MONBRDRAFT_13798, partial [Monosiga brevicollis MX1]
VCIRVAASAVNRADTLQRKGNYAPPPGSSQILGLEAAGVIEAVADDVTTLKPQQRVMALLGGGGYAQYVCVPAGHVLPVPTGMELHTAGGLMETWLTAFQLLHLVAGVKSGDRVLIHAGGSGVGLAAVQLAKAAGAIPLVTAGSDAKIAKAQSLGATAGYNRHNGSWATALKEQYPDGVQVVLDCVGGSYWQDNTEVLAVDGTWVVYGLMGGPSVEGPILGKILRKRLRVIGTTLRSRDVAYKAELVARFGREALPQLASGEFEVVIDRQYPIQEAAEAHRFVESNGSTGKVLLIVEAPVSKDEL